MKSLDAVASSKRSSTSREPATASLAERLSSIEISALEETLRLRSEQARIDGYRQRAQQFQGAIEESVRRRVLQDYASRHADLERKVAPLKAQVHTEYQKLRALFETISAARETARLDKEELELRHAVGELDDAELGRRIKEPERVFDQCGSDLTSLDKLDARFLDVLRPGPSEIDSASQPAVNPPRADSSPVPEESANPRVADEHDDNTRVAQTASLTGSAAPVGTGRDVSDPDHTLLLPHAALLVASGDVIKKEYRLGALSNIGRSPGNQIQLKNEGVSRRHACVSLTSAGFCIEDNDSENGTFVNSHQISRHMLVDGDRIDIGDLQLTFRAPWPKAFGA